MIKYLYAICSVLFLISCGSDDELELSPEKVNEAVKRGHYSAIVLERGGVKLTEVHNIPHFEDVEVSLEAENQRFKLGKNELEFITNFFNIGQRTIDQDQHKVKNEEGGQYLSVINNNGPTKRQFGNYIEADLQNGDNYYLCFLSRSYNISLKAPKTAFLFNITAGENGCSSNTNVMDTVAYAIHQPSGIYTGLEREKILLDFYLKNVSIGDNGNYAIIKIDDTEFKITKWSPYWITGLKKGSHMVGIEIFNKGGEIINSVFPDQCLSRIELKTIDLFSE